MSGYNNYGAGGGGYGNNYGANGMGGGMGGGYNTGGGYGMNNPNMAQQPVGQQAQGGMYGMPQQGAGMQSSGYGAMGTGQGYQQPAAMPAEPMGGSGGGQFTSAFGDTFGASQYGQGEDDQRHRQIVVPVSLAQLHNHLSGSSRLATQEGRDDILLRCVGFCINVLFADKAADRPMHEVQVDDGSAEMTFRLAPKADGSDNSTLELLRARMNSMPHIVSIIALPTVQTNPPRCMGVKLDIIEEADHNILTTHPLDAIFAHITMSGQLDPSEYQRAAKPAANPGGFGVKSSQPTQGMGQMGQVQGGYQAQGQPQSGYGQMPVQGQAQAGMPPQSAQPMMTTGAVVNPSVINETLEGMRACRDSNGHIHTSELRTKVGHILQRSGLDFQTLMKAIINEGHAVECSDGPMVFFEMFD